MAIICSSHNIITIICLIQKQPLPLINAFQLFVITRSNWIHSHVYYLNKNLFVVFFLIQNRVGIAHAVCELKTCVGSFWFKGKHFCEYTIWEYSLAFSSRQFICDAWKCVFYTKIPINSSKLYSWSRSHV